MKEIILRFDEDEVKKILNALNHIQLTGDEYIDSTISTLIDVFNTEIADVYKNGNCQFKIKCPDCGYYDYLTLLQLIKRKNQVSQIN